MKYSSLKSSKSKVFKIPLALGGVNNTDLATEIEDNQLTKGLNVWNDGGMLRSRPGIYTEAQNVLEDSLFSYMDQKNFHFTNTSYYFEGEYRRIAYAIGLSDTTNAFIFVFLVSGDRSVKNIGNIYFARVTDETFYYPESVNFFVGKGQQGSGIYAFVSMKNFNNPAQKSYRIYEADSNFDKWHSTISYYIPTVLINGRGNHYELAKSEAGVSLKSPMELEAPNLLNPNFYAYYTSDGYSSTFRLPYSAITNRTVTCRVYYSSEKFVDWVIYDYETSKKVTFDGKEVEVRLDREKGVIYFYQNGAEFSVPRYSVYSENNIRILASKEEPNSFNEVVSCKSSAILGSRILFSGGEMGNKIYYTKFENPLYFPKISNNEIGNFSERVTALFSAEDKVLAFKEKELYEVSLKYGECISATALLADMDTLFYKNDKISAECVSKSAGSLYPLSISLCGDVPVWLGTNGKIYCYKNSPFVVSNNIKLDENFDISAPAAASFGKHYILCCGADAVIMELEESASKANAAFYFWRFPEEVKAIGVICGLKPCFIFENKTENICFSASLKGNEDVIISTALGERITLPCEILSIIKTKSFNFGSFSKKKLINNICLQLDSKGEIEVKLGSGEEIFGEYRFEECDFSSKLGFYKRIALDFAGVNLLDITIKSSKGFSFALAEVYYSELNFN